MDAWLLQRVQAKYVLDARIRVNRQRRKSLREALNQNLEAQERFKQNIFPDNMAQKERQKTKEEVIISHGQLVAHIEEHSRLIRTLKEAKKDPIASLRDDPDVGINMKRTPWGGRTGLTKPGVLAKTPGLLRLPRRTPPDQDD